MFCSALTSVTIPKNVKKIGRWAFTGNEETPSGLEEVTIEDGCSVIGQQMFQSCTSLKSITIPASVTEIGAYAFDECTALKSVTLADGLTALGYGMFEGCEALESITIPDGITEIPDHAFVMCTALSSVTLPESVKKIGEGAFGGCTALTSVDDLLLHVEEVGGYAFGETGITEVTIPANVKLREWKNEKRIPITVFLLSVPRSNPQRLPKAEGREVGDCSKGARRLLPLRFPVLLRH